VLEELGLADQVDGLVADGIVLEASGPPGAGADRRA
jgi:hypothetical protein